jgi:hypothetical protein
LKIFTGVPGTLPSLTPKIARANVGVLRLQNEAKAAAIAMVYIDDSKFLMVTPD